jgi:glutamate formiminotransferase/formiminotetrahydrofolate cyclodeaminase
MAANRASATSPEEEKRKEELVLSANKYAAEVPLEVANLSIKIFNLAELMVEEGNPNSVSDAGVANEAAYAAVRGACLNVLINLDGIESDDKYVESMKAKVEKLLAYSEKLHKKLFEKTRKVIDK